MKGSGLSFASKLKRFYSSKFCSSSSYLFLGKDTSAIATVLSLSANSKSYVLGIQIHGRIIKLGYSNDIFSQNNLINMYSKCGVLISGLKVFDEMAERNLVSWTLIISGAVQNDELKMGLEVILEMTRNGLRPNEFALGSVIKACTVMRADKFGLCIHSFVLKIGIEKNPIVGSSVLNMYAKSGDIQAAEQVFERMDSLDVGCWNSMIGGYAQCGCGFEAVKIVSLMQGKGVSMDKFTFINVLKGCSSDLDFGREIHGLIIRSKVECSSTSVMNALVDMYFKCGRKSSALGVFSKMHDRDVISWNTVFAGFFQDENVKEVARFFHEFLLTGSKPNHVTFSILFRQCGELLELHFGLQFCCLALQFGYLGEGNVSSSLIYMFSRCGSVEMASLVFDSIPSKNIVTWNEMISGYSLNSCYMEALNVFRNLWQSGVEANEYTFSSILEACSRMENQQISRQIHVALVKSGFLSNGYVCCSLIKAYVGFGLLDDSFEFFNGHEKLHLASWGAMISALVHRGCNYLAIKLLNYLIEAGEKPDEFILGSFLNGCANIAAYHQTKSAHSLIIKTGLKAHAFVASALIDSYAKCGDIESAGLAFDQSCISGDVVLLNTMIMAYAHHGLVMEAMEIFDKMKLANLQPSQATFVAVISACGHLGIVDQGLIFFKSINLDYGMEPSADNYGCLVDMLSRNGFLEDAKHIIEVMPFPPWPAILRSLLSGCRIHGNMQLGEWSARKLIQLVPENDAAYVLLSKVYSEGGSWEDAAKVRRGMTGRGVHKDPAYSWIDI